jgi:2-keto-4-pentenoate hydratase
MMSARAREWLITLASFEIKLYCNVQLIDRGDALNILDGPLSALRHLVELLSRDPDNLPLAAGEIVATGTLTRALAVKAGETWTTKLSDIALRALLCDFAEASATKARHSCFAVFATGVRVG